MQPIYAFIGGGNMGRALVGGLIAGGHPPAAIRVAEPHAPSRELCVQHFGVEVGSDNREACADADVVVLAVKPQQLKGVALAVAGAAPPHALYLSIAAGITTTHLGAWLGASRPIVRCMPNTPALVGQGAAVMFANEHVSGAQTTLAEQLLGAVGLALWVDDEALMDAVTAVSGSGPAYFFLFIELIETIAIELGLPAAISRTLALQTARGAAELSSGSQLSPGELRAQVTSPGGTTERALASFAADDLEGIVRRALTSARDRSRELARQVEA